MQFAPFQSQQTLLSLSKWKISLGVLNFIICQTEQAPVWLLTHYHQSVKQRKHLLYSKQLKDKARFLKGVLREINKLNYCGIFEDRCEIYTFIDFHCSS